MSTIEGIYSIRLVIADFYMEKPIFGLDPCYSELRGKEIKRVPIIRIFGPNANGQKCCTHIHGVFPYFYIPYDKRDFETLQRGIFQIATGLDKAINISLGQGSSSALHVFKIQLVKGIPFYGYHRGEHQFLKIYMFNPRFVRRAANLLQNGAILNKNFNPHESHVPYVLQFMIDYNLYGMSFMHVPIEIVKFRRNNDDDDLPYPNVKAAQILDTLSCKKVSCSQLEVDISSNFILNRFQLITKTNHTHTNPGIEAIWHDERLRRQKLAQGFNGDQAKLNALPILEVPATQPRPNVEIAESEIFYSTALTSKLLSMENSILASGNLADQTITDTTNSTSNNITLNSTAAHTNEKRSTFNLTKLLANAVYPEECTPQEEQLLNASFIQNHLSDNNVFQKSLEQLNNMPKSNRSEDIFLDDTIIDEELVLSLTQQQPHVPLNASLREEDLQLLDVLQQLEEANAHNDQVDLDSSLAPISQPEMLTPKLLDKEIMAAVSKQPISESDTESENANEDNLLDFSIAMDNIDEYLIKHTQNLQYEENKSECAEHVPQIDGADDALQQTPKKNKLRIVNDQLTSPVTPKTKQRITNKTTPTRSPRTPKSNTIRKYAPLPLVFTNSGQKVLQHESNTTSIKSTAAVCPSLDFDAAPSSSSVCLRKKLAMTELRRKSIAVAPDELMPFVVEPLEERVHENSTNMSKSRRRRTIDLDKTHVTCALIPRRKNERLLKVYTPDKDKSEEIKSKKSDQEEKNSRQLTKTKTLELDSCFTKIKTKTKLRSDPINKVRNEHKATTTSLIKIKECKVRIRRLRFNQSKEDGNQLNQTLQNCLEADDSLVLKVTPESEKTASPLSAVLTESEDEQIMASDTESDITIKKLRKTPNLKRLRSSFRERLQAKRMHIPNGGRTLNLNFEKNVDGGLQQKVAERKDDTSKHKSTTCQSCSPTSSNATNDEEQNLMESFYEQSFLVNSPSVFSEDVPSPNLNKTPTASGDSSKLFLNSISNTPPDRISWSKSSNSFSSAADGKVIVTPLDLPPTYDEVLDGCLKFDIHEHEFQNPYYSNPDDITKMKEVGFMVLQIPGNKLNDCTEFESLLNGDGAMSLNAWRRKQLISMGGTVMLNRYRNSAMVKEYFATGKKVIIETKECAPSRQDAKIWLKARELLINKGLDLEREKPIGEEDSPIKIRRQKVTMMLNEDGAAADSDGEDVDCSTMLTLTPMTPGTPLHKATTLNNESLTPVTTKNHKESTSVDSVNKCKRRSARRAKQSLGEKLNSVALTPKIRCIASEQLLETMPASQDSFKTSQASESSNYSQAALAELERSSFVRQLQHTSGQHDVSFGLTSASLNNTFGFKVNLENLQQAKADIEYNYLTTMTLEVFVPTREDLYPDPMHDELGCLFYAIEHSIPAIEDSQSKQLPTKACGYIIVNDLERDIVTEGRIHGIDADIQVQVVRNEVDALEALLALVELWDPDIYAGYEIEMNSWGFVIERAKYLCCNIAPRLSRVPTQNVREFVDEDREQFTDLDVEMKICGRILLDVWRLMRSEIALTSYTFENVMFHILHKRCPLHTYRSLTSWFASPCSRWIVIEYYLERVRGTLALLDQLDLIGRTSEMAKLIGIQFYEVLSRGSQFRVESMMLRIAKPKNLVPLSPSVQQRAHMRAPEYLALIMEPQSRFYADPLIVLDFQSLYPSMIIAYNYCFSTCLGRVEHLGQSTPFEFGASHLRVSPTMLKKLLEKDLVTISPCGVVFVKSCVREGILPRMLTEILDTRQMVKQSMKVHKNNTALQRILHSRQLGLKLMANVTYGYTAANFSGRMPAVEVGDTVVSKGRETLERAIKLVEENDKWNVRVVYGDTDSMFVLVPGRNREQAFQIGEEIADAVTKINPHPVKLKLEKVYQPCILQTKKRYVGYMYETPDQTEPVYEAKGIETVRRDGCPAVAKMLEKVLRILFETADVSKVKEYVCRQFTKLLSGRANLQDLIFAKEFRGLNGYKPTACVPALELTRKWLQNDPRHIPRRGERVPFIIINGPPGMQLIRLVRSPHELLANEGYKINAMYYITKAIIPPLNRCLLLIGADVHEWFTNLPRKLLITPALSSASELIGKTNNPNQLKKSTISQYFSNTNCVVDCGRQTKQSICSNCSTDALKCIATLQSKICKYERGYHLTQQICQACCGRVGDLKCASLDCPVLYVLEGKCRDLPQVEHFRKLLMERF